MRSTLADEELDWAERLRRALDLRPEWAAHAVVVALPEELIGEALELVAQSGRGRRSRNWLRMVLANRLRRGQA